MDAQARTTRVSAPYGRLRDAIAGGRCVLLDGGIGTELPRAAARPEVLDEHLWGVGSLVDAPDAVARVHRDYVAAGCDVITTNTWGLPTALADEGSRGWELTRSVHWVDVARRGIALARTAIADGGRAGEVAVAFSLNGDLDSPAGGEMIGLLARLFADEPPDLVLVETLALVRPSLFAAVEALLDTGLPVWLSFRRCRHGLCGVYGQHWGGPEGDAFGRAALRFEQLGVQALLINCIPPDHVAGMVSYLRDFTDLPLGVYPNLGYLTDGGWRSAPGVGPDEYAALAGGWREEGAQVIGGCCGTGPEHIAATRDRVAGTAPGRARPRPEASDNGERDDGERAPRWTDRRGRTLYPLPFPDLVCEPGVAVPGAVSYMVWEHLFADAVGAHQRCLDVGCGTGIQAVQLARNGATHVRALDVDPRAVANTLTNAFRNDVADRVTASAVDLFPWVPEERYEVIVASLFEVPVDPFRAVTGHRPVDYWGRGLLDQLIGHLPEALAPEGAAYLVQLSVASQERTLALLAAHGLAARVADHRLFGFTPALAEEREQIARVEELSDAYHVRVGPHDAMVAYLLEVRHA